MIMDFIPSSEPQGSVPQLRDMRVLVVEDDDDARELVVTAFSSAGANVSSACDATQGFELAHQRPDVIVSDVGMPGEDGYAMVRRIRALPASAGGDVPVVALTAFTRESDRAEAADAGFTAFMTKPLNVRALLSVVSLLGSRTGQQAR